MFGDTQDFKPRDRKHYRQVGRGGLLVGGVPYWELFNGVSFGSNYGYYGQGVDPQVAEAGEPAGEESNEGTATGDTTSVGDGTSAAGSFGSGPV